MSNPERDTKFQGFAKLLMDELGDQGFVFDGADDANREEHLEQIKLLIARRAYDFMEHVIGYLSSYEYDVAICDQDLIDCIPDMTMFHKDNNSDERRDTTRDC